MSGGGGSRLRSFGYTARVQAEGDGMESEILDFVRGHFAAAVGKTPFRPDTRLFSTGIVDSFGVLELIAFVERAFGVDIDLSAHALEDFDTASKIAALVRRLQSTVT
jgi:acyl carrier protein